MVCDPNTVYRRGQVDWSLWHMFSKVKLDEPPLIFRSRVIRLLETDRDLCRDFKRSQHAFMEGAPVSSGNDAVYRFEHAFSFAFAMMMMDCGFNQSDVVWTVQAAGKSISKMLKQIFDIAPTTADHAFALKTFEKGGAAIDPRCFVTMTGVEMSEIFSKAPQTIGELGKKRRRKEPRVLIGPDFVGDHSQLAAVLNKMGRNSPDKYLVFEIGYPARRLKELLAQAPIRKRGRKA